MGILPINARSPKCVQTSKYHWVLHCGKKTTSCGIASDAGKGWRGEPEQRNQSNHEVDEELVGSTAVQSLESAIHIIIYK
jgi:hypothetical protein